jgi:hypothetical protein
LPIGGRLNFTSYWKQSAFRESGGAQRGTCSPGGSRSPGRAAIEPNLRAGRRS